jgi:hypothetical protein
MASFMQAQSYINNFDIMSPEVEISHNLDRFRPLFVNHPGNYVDVYSSAFNHMDKDVQTELRTRPWLTVPSPRVIDGRTIIINRTQRWLPPTLSPQWATWKSQGIEERALFVGLPDEYIWFKQQTGLNIPYYETATMLDLAEVIAGGEMFIGNQSQALALAIGLGQNFCCELRQDLPVERNECYFPDQPGGNYF